MNIVTGYTGTPHVTANAQQAFNMGVFGNGNRVLNVGNKFHATLTDANTITIDSGEGVMQGVHFRIDPGQVETVNIDNGTSGKNRIDLICARYTKDPVTGIEDVSLAVIKGTETTGAPSQPSYNHGTILTGGTPVDFPMFRVTLTGLTPTITWLFQTDVSVINPPNISQIAEEQLSQGTWYSHISVGEYCSAFAQSSSGDGATAAISATPGFTSGVWASVSALSNNAAATPWIYIPSGTTYYTFGIGTGGVYRRLAMPL